MSDRIRLPSLSAAMDGAFTAITEISAVLDTLGELDNTRLIGGVAVLLHVERLHLALTPRATTDADFGMPPLVLRREGLLPAIEEAGYQRVRGNRWERRIDASRTATVDLLVPTYRTRARDTVRVGDVVTTEVPGLAEALQRPGLGLDVDFVLTDGTSRVGRIIIPDAAATLALKAWARTVRSDERDAGDLWRCLEVAAADGVTPDDFDSGQPLHDARGVLVRELRAEGPVLTRLTSELSHAAGTRMRTRLRALAKEVVGID